MGRKKVILWFRQDLRLHDNEAIQDAVKSGDEIIPIFVFDPRVFQNKTPFGFPKTGGLRLQFIIDAVHDLRKNIRALGSELYVRIGKPEELIYEIAREEKTSWVFCNRERTQEEKDVQDELENKLWSIGQEIRFSRGKMLYYTADLPFPVTHTPDHFLQFRKEVEKLVNIRKPLKTENELANIDLVELEVGDIPKASDFGVDEITDDKILSGESTGLDVLNDLIETDKDYTVLSSYLAQGCLSPKMVYDVLIRNNMVWSKKKKADLYMGLLHRDFMRLMLKRHGNAIFQFEGTNGVCDLHKERDAHKIKLWIEGKTGEPLIDASMRKLSKTGLLSKNLRSLVAGYFVRFLNQDWRVGAEYFESVLLDYDPCSNWGNWNEICGIGCDGKEEMPSNLLALQKRIDPSGEFIRAWLPKLSALSNSQIHEPYNLDEAQCEELGFVLERDYCRQII